MPPFAMNLEELAEPSFRNTLIEEHQRIEEAIHRLLDHVGAAEGPRRLAAWDDFEALLNAHMDAEEEHLLPPFAEHDPARAQKIAEEHTQIRAWLGAIDMEIEGGRLPTGALAELADFLRRHAAEEAKGLYEWADEWLAESVFLAMTHAAPPVVRHQEMSAPAVIEGGPVSKRQERAA
jgi:hemerythrin-like domain-containing protein